MNVPLDTRSLPFGYIPPLFHYTIPVHIPLIRDTYATSIVVSLISHTFHIRGLPHNGVL